MHTFEELSFSGRTLIFSGFGELLGDDFSWVASVCGIAVSEDVWVLQLARMAHSLSCLGTTNPALKALWRMYN